MPRPGDVSVCFGCTAMLVFDHELRVRLMSEDELLALPLEDPNCWRGLRSVQDTIREYHRRFPS